MSFALNATLAPSACGAYIDPLAIAPSSRILGAGSFSFSYTDAQLACLLAGLVALVVSHFVLGSKRHLHASVEEPDDDEGGRSLLQ